MNTVFRPKGNLVWAAMAFILDGFFVFQLLVFPVAAGSEILDFAIAVVVAALAYLLWVKPKLILGEKTLTVVNPLKSFTIAYDEIDEIQTKWSLQIHYRGTKVPVWVAPANGKSRWIAESTFQWRNNRVPLTENKLDSQGPISSTEKSDSGLAAALILERMKH